MGIKLHASMDSKFGGDFPYTSNSALFGLLTHWPLYESSSSCTHVEFARARVMWTSWSPLCGTSPSEAGCFLSAVFLDRFLLSIQSVSRDQKLWFFFVNYWRRGGEILVLRTVFHYHPIVIVVRATGSYQLWAPKSGMMAVDGALSSVKPSFLKVSLNVYDTWYMYVCVMEKEDIIVKVAFSNWFWDRFQSPIWVPQGRISSITMQCLPVGLMMRTPNWSPGRSGGASS